MKPDGNKGEQKVMKNTRNDNCLGEYVKFTPLLFKSI